LVALLVVLMVPKTDVMWLLVLLMLMVLVVLMALSALAVVLMCWC
jgi:hypothetical protein